MNIVNFKQNIYEEQKICEVLDKLGCHSIKIEQNGTIITAGLPDGDNKRSVQVKNNSFLNACIRSKGIVGIDLFDIVSYIKFDEHNKDDMEYSRSMAINWVKKVLDINMKDYSGLEWVEKAKTKVKNNPLNEKILNQYMRFPNKKWIDEGINYDTQKFFNIAYNLNKNQIVIPIYDKDSQLIGVKARNLDEDRYDMKYIYLYPCNASANLYGLNIARKYIKNDNTVILFESEKSVMKAFQYGYRNAVALGCKDITMTQISLLKEFVNDNTKIILAFDKDVYYVDKQFDFKHLKSIDKLFKEYDLYAIIDKDNLISEKDSPTDINKEIFDDLLKNAFLIKDLKEKDFNNEKEGRVGQDD